jgi:hypothetical protein
MHSLSGGTGSGAASRLLETLRDEFGAKKYIVSQSVAPFAAGELPLQHYNNLLCLAHLHQFADAVLLFQNDDVLALVERASEATKPLPKAGGNNKLEKPSVSLGDMNAYIIRLIFVWLFLGEGVNETTFMKDTVKQTKFN